MRKQAPPDDATECPSLRAALVKELRKNRAELRAARTEDWLKTRPNFVRLSADPKEAAWHRLMLDLPDPWRARAAEEPQRPTLMGSLRLILLESYVEILREKWRREKREGAASKGQRGSTACAGCECEAGCHAELEDEIRELREKVERVERRLDHILERSSNTNILTPITDLPSLT